MSQLKRSCLIDQQKMELGTILLVLQALISFAVESIRGTSDLSNDIENCKGGAVVF